MPYASIWEYRVPDVHRLAFEAHYAPDGTWARLFRRHLGYLGTDLLRDPGQPDRYLTIDRWVSRDAFDAFRAAHGEAYERLDRECEGLTSAERMIGGFETLGG